MILNERKYVVEIRWERKFGKKFCLCFIGKWKVNIWSLILGYLEILYEGGYEFVGIVGCIYCYIFNVKGILWFSN